MKSTPVNAPAGSKVVLSYPAGGGRLAGTTTKAAVAGSNGQADVKCGSGKATVYINGRKAGTQKT